MYKPASLKVLSIVKLLLVIAIAILGVVGSAIALRKVCLPARAEERKYTQVLNPTIIYRNNDLSDAMITAPTGYYLEILSSTGDLYRVRYGEITGFVRFGTEPAITTMLSEPATQTAEIETKSDAGTHLRKAPSVASEKIVVIPAGTKLTYIGEISGDIPSDGTSKMWYFVRFDSGDTTTHSGYVYSERIRILSGKEERPAGSNSPNSSTPSPDTLPTTATGNTTETDLTSQKPKTISSGLKIFLVILFSTLAVIIFALLLISPKGKSERGNRERRFLSSSAEFSEFSEPELSNTQKKDKKTGNFHKNQTEFGEFVEFSQPIERKEKSNRKTPTRLFSSVNSSDRLPSALSKYFKIERTTPPDSDDELL